MEHAIGWAVVIGMMYMFPAIVAGFRSHHNTMAIFTLNLLLGWTFVGWVGSLVWALTNPSR